MKCTIQKKKKKHNKNNNITIPGKDNNYNTISVVWNNLMKEKKKRCITKKRMCVCANLYERIIWSTGENEYQYNK